LNCRKDIQYNETTLFNKRRQVHSYYCVVCRSSSGNQRTCLLDMGGVMSELDYEKLEVEVIVTYKGKRLDDFDASDESLYSIYDDVKKYLEDE